MTYQTTKLIANILGAIGLLVVVAFTVTHFTPSMRPTWRREALWLGLAFLIVARMVRRYAYRQVPQGAD